MFKYVAVLQVVNSELYNVLQKTYRLLFKAYNAVSTRSLAEAPYLTQRHCSAPLSSSLAVCSCPALCPCL